MAVMSIILITGIQAAGKSTVAHALAETIPNSVHVRGDLFRRMIVNGRADMGAAVPEPRALEQLRLRYEMAAEVADRYAQAGFTVVLQDVILGRALRDVVDHITTRPLSVVVLVPAPAVVAARDAERQQLRGKVAYKPGDEGIEVLDEYLRSATLRLGYWLDTSTIRVLLESPSSSMPARIASVRRTDRSDPKRPPIRAVSSCCGPVWRARSA